MKPSAPACWSRCRASPQFAVASAVLGFCASHASAQTEDFFTGTGQALSAASSWTPSLPGSTSLGDVDTVGQSSGINQIIAIYTASPPAANSFSIGALQFDTTLITPANPLIIDASTDTAATAPQTLQLQGQNTAGSNDLLTITSNVTGDVYFRGLNGGGNSTGSPGLTIQIPLAGGYFSTAPSVTMEIGGDAYLATAPGTPTAPLTVQGGGTLLLDNPNSAFTSDLALQSASVDLGPHASIASNNITVASGSQLQVQSGGSISPSSNLTVNGMYTEYSPTREIAALNGSGSVQLNGTSLGINGGGTFSGSISNTSSASLTVIGGILTLSGHSTYTGTTNIDAGAALNIAGTGSLSASTDVFVPAASPFPSVTQTGVKLMPAFVQATLVFQANPNPGILARSLASLNLSFNGQVSIAPPSASSSRTVLVTSGLNFTSLGQFWAGLLDLSANDMIDHHGNLANITQQIAQGYDNGAWNGIGGITSSAAALTNNTALGVQLNAATNGQALFSTFDGQPVTNTDVLVKYTYFGDANLDGVVNGSDYTLIDNGFNNQLIGWRNGDFNYDGVVNGDDYTLIDNAFNTQGASLAAEPVEMVASDTAQLADAAGSSVPEPGTMSVAAIAAMRFLARRRRRISTHLTYRA